MVSIFLVQSNNFASLQILRDLRLSDLRLHLHRADSRPSKVCMAFLAIILTLIVQHYIRLKQIHKPKDGMKCFIFLRWCSFLQDHKIIKTTSGRAHSTSLTVQDFSKDCVGTKESAHDHLNLFYKIKLIKSPILQGPEITWQFFVMINIKSASVTTNCFNGFATDISSL